MRFRYGIRARGSLGSTLFRVGNLGGRFRGCRSSGTRRSTPGYFLLFFQNIVLTLLLLGLTGEAERNLLLLSGVSLRRWMRR